MNASQAEGAYSERERQRIRTHLQKLLESPAFTGSTRRQDFLRYLVEELLAGRGAAINETTIAVAVFGRSSDFNAQRESIVRVTCSKVRKHLAQAYESGLDSDVRIDLPIGGYRPFIQLMKDAPTPEEPPAQEVLPVPEQPRFHWRRWAVVAISVTAIAVPLAAKLAGVPVPGFSRDPIDQLWQPFLNHSHPVLISLQSPTLLNVFNAKKWLPLRAGESIPTSEMEALESSYVGTGGALGSALFAEQLASRGQHFVMKFGTDVSLADLKSSPAILIGPSRWTQEITRPLRFRVTVDDGSMTIHDSQDPARSWEVERPEASGTLAAGYSLVTRLLHAESDQPVLIVIGMDSRNTQAALEFLSQNGAFAAFSAHAPADWAQKNFQVVLRNSNHDNSLGSVQVAASQVW